MIAWGEVELCCVCGGWGYFAFSVDLGNCGLSSAHESSDFKESLLTAGEWKEIGRRRAGG